MTLNRQEELDESDRLRTIHHIQEEMKTLAAIIKLDEEAKPYEEYFKMGPHTKTIVHNRLLELAFQLQELKQS